MVRGEMDASDGPLPLFGYGSLILPTSLVSRFEEPDPPLNAAFNGSSLDEVYDVWSIEGENPLASEGVDRIYLRSSELDIWEKYSDQIQLVPAKISGFRRYYSNECLPEGTMLEVVRTGNPDDWINGVVIQGLSQDQYEAVTESERPLRRQTVDRELLDYYENIPVPDLEYDRVEIFVSENDPSEIGTTRRRNHVYHHRLLTGIILLGQRFGSDVAKRFYYDFRRTTYEKPPDSSDPREFNTISENEGGDPVPVVVETIGHFGDASFNDMNKYRNAILLPKELFDERDDLAPFDYVRVAHDWESLSKGELLPVDAFDSSHDAGAYRTNGCYEAGVRTSLQERIGVEIDTPGTETILIQPTDRTSIENEQVARISNIEMESRDFLTHGPCCYIHPDDLDTLQIGEGDDIEILNEETGQRAIIPAYGFRHRHKGESMIRLQGHTRKILNFEPRDNLGGDDEGTYSATLRTPPPRESRKLRRYWQEVTRLIGRFFVDYSQVPLRVTVGEDRDEGRKIIRADETVMGLLGIKQDEKVVISWRGRQRSARLQAPLSDDELDPLTVKIPSSLRDPLNLSVGDLVNIRRDMKYTFGKKITISLFSILAVSVGVINAFSPTTLSAYLTVFVVIVLISTVAVWFVLWPERQKCR